MCVYVCGYFCVCIKLGRLAVNPESFAGVCFVVLPGFFDDGKCVDVLFFAVLGDF